MKEHIKYFIRAAFHLFLALVFMAIWLRSETTQAVTVVYAVGVLANMLFVIACIEKGADLQEEAEDNKLLDELLKEDD